MHGYLDGPHSTPASLIAIRFELNNDSISTSSRRFRYFVPTLTFRQHPHGRASTDPWRQICEPKGSIYIMESYSKVTDTTWEISAGAQAPVPTSVSMNRKLGAGTSKESTRKYRYTVINGRRKSQTTGGERPGRDVVYWNSRENEQGNLGSVRSAAGRSPHPSARFG
jgi:hypothetical protein